MRFRRSPRLGKRLRFNRKRARVGRCAELGPLVFVSMELTDEDLAVRLVSVITSIRKEKLVTGAFDAEQG